MKNELLHFVTESNAIERIYRPPTEDELAVTRAFLELPLVRLADLEHFVRVCAHAPLRSRKNMDVYIHRYVPPAGGPQIVVQLERLLGRANQGADPYLVHLEYEALHPFMDGNGRSGRVLWAWQMRRSGQWPGLQYGFLHAFYYQVLEHQHRS